VTRIEAIIQPHKVEEVKEELARLGLTGLTAHEVKGFGRQRGQKELYRGGEYATGFLPKVKLEVVIPTPLVPRVVDTLTRAARGGRIGDGKIFASPVIEAVRIRTGDRGEEAL
jgi:nitrogen regulatory protein P-II 1